MFKKKTLVSSHSGDPTYPTNQRFFHASTNQARPDNGNWPLFLPALLLLHPVEINALQDQVLRQSLGEGVCIRVMHCHALGHLGDIYI